jgi:hypothetical protein
MFMRVGRGDEHHVGQVEVDLDVVVTEGVVLLGVEHFQKRRRLGSPRKSMPSLSISSSRKSGLRTPTLVRRLQHLARHRTDVGAAVAADFGFVTHAAQGHAHELAAGGARHTIWPRRGLANARGADQAQDGRLDLVDTLLHREVLEDAFLDLVKAVVVLVQHLFGVAAGRV